MYPNAELKARDSQGGLVRLLEAQAGLGCVPTAGGRNLD